MKKYFISSLLLLMIIGISQSVNLKAFASDTQFRVTDNATGVTILGYYSNEKTVVIPETIDGKPVTKIGDAAFFYLGLESVTLPSHLTSIGDSAFANNQLKEIVIPNTVTKIDKYAFASNVLEKVTFPQNLKTVSAHSFQNNHLTTIHLPDQLETIEASAFSSNHITEVTFPKSLKTIKSTVFSENLLQKVTFQGAVNVKANTFDLELFSEIFDHWYTNKKYKTKWTGKVPKAMTIYGNYLPDAATRKVKADHVAKNQFEFTNLETGFSYSLYKDAQLTKKLKTFSAKTPKQTVTVKGIGDNSGVMYVIASKDGYRFNAKKMTYETSRTAPLAKSNVNITQTSKQSTIQFANLKKATTYRLYQDGQQKQIIASFKATGKTKKMTTNQLPKKVGIVYVTAQQANYRESKLTPVCYPKGILCPKGITPSSAKLTEGAKDYLSYRYKKTLSGGAKVTKVFILKEENGVICADLFFESKNGYKFFVGFFSNRSSVQFTPLTGYEDPTKKQLEEARKIGQAFIDAFQ